MKIDENIIDRKSLNIFWTTWGISMKSSGEMWLMIMLKLTEKQGFTLSLVDTFSEKSSRGGDHFDSSQPF